MAITTWNRLEPDVAHDDPLRGLDESLAARLADPLWMLARQWQMGELRGEDGGSLVTSRVAVASYPVSELRIGGDTQAVSADVPLEVRVEPEPGVLDLALRVAGGEMFEALLVRHGLGHLSVAARDRFQWPAAGGPGGALGRLAGARFADGLLVAASAAAGTLAHDLGATGADAAAVGTVGIEWRAWYERRVRPTSPDSWIPDRLEHGFSVRAHAAEGWLTLDTPEYPGGRLDWDSFVVADVTGDPALSVERVTSDALPLLLDVPGMPVVRYWEVEDPRFDPARVPIGPGDLAAALVVEVSLSFASDWFLLPLVIPVGALHRVEQLVVTDTFGVAHLIRPAAQVRVAPEWCLWALSPGRDDLPSLDYLFTPPTVSDTLLGEPIEEVALYRDELANVVWAIERVVADSSGRGAIVDRRRPPASAPVSEADLVYVPLPPLPADRVPMLLESTATGGQFRRADSVDVAMEIAVPVGTLLTPDLAIREEEIGRDGLVVTRRWQLALDAAGNRHVWCTRSKAPGASQRSVRLAFDDLAVPRRRT